MNKTKILVAASVLCAAFAAQAEKITIWSWDPHYNVAIMQDAAAIYQKTHPEVTFDIVDLAKADLEQKLQTMLASGMTKALPDIVLVEDYNAPKYLRSFPGAFAPLNGKIDFTRFAKYKVDLMTIEGKTYGVPFDTGVTVWYYRQDLVEQAGYSAKDLQNITWDKFIEIGKKVEEKTGKKMMAIDPNDAGLIRVMMQSAGRWYFDKAGNLDIVGNPALKAALETQAKLTRSGIVKPVIGWAEWVGAFNRGDVASVVTGVWATGSIKAEAKQSGLWNVAPIPALTVEGATHASNLGGSSWYVMESSPEKAQAIQFLNEIYVNNIDFYQHILHKNGAMGSNLNSREGEAYKQPDPYFGNTPIWSTFSDWLKVIPAVNYGMYTYEADAAVGAQLPALKDGAPVDGILKNIEQQVKTQIQ
ncbi:ABC transporter substrate-binding protein [Superficieibacter electus]|uniref:ABC transporter substrate-binding protein n=1 Tax=Superficieibacter electus TaxID=2022662 RepID=A0A2P5GLH6_9ENTR|nr:extracellular solute-binding protein [Superficieibacter electus]POP43820.1 ABC transporter substrate-binding protein [Superficieibacter electus]POP46126.1 ABC transporter substrate-binding protein [Superficieibacter electus]